MTSSGSGKPPEQPNRIVIGDVVVNKPPSIAPPTMGQGAQQYPIVQYQPPHAMVSAPVVSPITVVPYTPPPSTIVRVAKAAIQYPEISGPVGVGVSGVFVLLGVLAVMLVGLPFWPVAGVTAALSTLSAGTGLWLIRYRKRLQGRVGIDPGLQQRILQAAVQSNGRLTVTSTAHMLGITLDQAENALQALSRSGYVDTEIEQDRAVVVYIFRELISRQ